MRRIPNNWSFWKPEHEAEFKIVRVAERRCEALMRHAIRSPLPRLLESAYLQGMRDAIDALDKR